MTGKPVASAFFRVKRGDVLIQVAADGVEFASLPLPVEAARHLYQDLGIALSVADGEAPTAATPKYEPNRTDAAKSLLAEIEGWCARTATPETAIGHKLFLHPGFVGLLRKRLTLSVEKEAAARAFLRQHPEGWAGDLPVTHGNGTHPVNPPEERATAPARAPYVPIVSRDPCQRCGARGDFDCGHSRQRLGTVL